MQNLKLSKLITEAQLEKRILEMGKTITDRFRNEDLTAVCILKGSFMFYSDLVRAIETDLRCEFLGVSSYAGASSSGEVKLTLDLSSSVANKNVLLVEDIVDTGLTMDYLLQTVKMRKPKSITTASLLFKPEALKTKVKLDYVGFEIPNEFVVGYGLDYQGHYRNLPYIARVENLN